MTSLKAAAPAVVLSALWLGACGSTIGTAGAGGTTGSTSAGGTSGSGGNRTPMLHRATETACGDRPPGNGGIGNSADECKADAECTTGANGRCVAPLGGATFCSYDQCAADADCGSASVCSCRTPANYQANTCFHGTCRLDADCGEDGYCSPSAASIFDNCLTGIEQGSVGYFCHQPNDECVDDTDCGEMGSVCLFNVAATHWVCHQLVCTK